VKPIKMLGLVALAALMAMAFVGASSATGEGSTALCKVEESPCASGNRITHFHRESSFSVHSYILWSGPTVECETLALGDALNSGLGNPLIIHDKYSFSCLEDCTVTEENGPTELKILRKIVTVGSPLLHVVCVLNCRYNGVGMEGSNLDALAAANGEGEIIVSEQELNKESGLFCPSSSLFSSTEAFLTGTYTSS